VCLLGLDDGSFPRHFERDGDDLTARQQRVGDRDVRSEDRQLLLDALLAAGEHLVVTYSGRDERSNQVRPPAVPVGELLDVVDHTVRTEKARPRDVIVVAHPLQPFDRRNYTPGALVPGRAWSFDSLHLAGAEAARTPRQAAHAFLEAPLEGSVPSQLGLDQLERFVRHPVRAFLRERLHVSLRNRTRDFEDAIPIDLDGLGTWQIAERVLQARLVGASLEDCLEAERARGGLPPGQLADPVLDDMVRPLEDLVHAGQCASPPASVDVRVTLADDLDLVGTVAGVRGDVVHHVTYSKLSPATRLMAWVRLLVVSATWPERAFEARSIGRSSQRQCTTSVATLGPLGADAASRRELAVEHLRVLVDLFDRGMREPLPLYCRTTAAWVAAVADGKDADKTRAAAVRAWESSYDFDREDKEPEHVLVLGAAASFDEMLGRAGAPRGDEAAWDPTEMSRFALLARRLWAGMLDHEVVTDR